jgi:DNA replicative helicase MCM subunit Mcm2 (Cdc46/Mcm family)
VAKPGDRVEITGVFRAAATKVVNTHSNAYGRSRKRVHQIVLGARFFFRTLLGVLSVCVNVHELGTC